MKKRKIIVAVLLLVFSIIIMKSINVKSKHINSTKQASNKYTNTSKPPIIPDGLIHSRKYIEKNKLSDLFCKADISSFPLKNKYRGWQGVDTDGKYIYVATDRNSNFNLEDIISVYTMNGTFIKEKRKAYTGTDSSGKFLSFGDCKIINGFLYATAYNFNSGGRPYESRVAKYSIPYLNYIGDYSIGGNVAESVNSYLGDFWVCYYDVQRIKRFDSNFHLKATYSLPQPIGPYGGYQTIIWDSNNVYLNLHGPNTLGLAYSTGFDHYTFDGNKFTFVERFKPPTYGCGQGVSKLGSTWYWNDRVLNRIVITKINNLQN
jgi:hypothetical protein